MPGGEHQLLWWPSNACDTAFNFCPTASRVHETGMLLKVAVQLVQHLTLQMLQPHGLVICRTLHVPNLAHSLQSTPQSRAFRVLLCNSYIEHGINLVVHLGISNTM